VSRVEDMLVFEDWKIERGQRTEARDGEGGQKKRCSMTEQKNGGHEGIKQPPRGEKKDTIPRKNQGQTHRRRGMSSKNHRACGVKAFKGTTSIKEALGPSELGGVRRARP